MQASAACHQLALLAYHVVCDKKDLASLQSLACGDFLFLLLHICIEDTDPLAAIPENGNALQPFLVGVHVESFRLLHRESVRHVYRGADGGVDMLLPDGLHVDPLTVIQCHGCHKVVRQLRVALDAELLHIGLHDLRVHLIVDICPVEGLGLSLIVVCVDWLNASGNAQHGGQCSRGRDGQELGVAKTVLFHQLPCLLCRVCQEIGGAHNLIDLTGRVCALLFGQLCRGGDR